MFRNVPWSGTTSSAVTQRPLHGDYYSFNAWISSAFYYSYTGSISVSAYASFRDYDCEPSYQCERNVVADFELRSGIGSYGRLISRATAQTGQYGSSMYVNSFRVPSCRYIPRYHSVTYTILMEAVAPNGAVRTSTKYVYARSCR